jgi:hypothetical protein
MMLERIDLSGDLMDTHITQILVLISELAIFLTIYIAGPIAAMSILAALIASFPLYAVFQNNE